MMMRAAATLLCLYAGSVFAQGAPAASEWLARIYRATQTLSYRGTFVYQQDARSETSRIVRLVEGGTDMEKLELLDGAPQDVVRNGDILKWYLPATRTIKVESRGDRRGFPAVLPEQLATLEENYTLSLGELRRIAGFDCQEIVLAPRDRLRYGHRLWADVQSAMLIKAETVDENAAPIEQFTFTQLTLGGVTRDDLRLRYATGGWRIQNAAVTKARLADRGWSVGAALPGFRKVAEVSRRFGDAPPVGQVVYSDGLAAVSVFIDPRPGGEQFRAGLARMGVVHIYTRAVANHIVTVIGEAPAASVQRLANAVEFHAVR